MADNPLLNNTEDRISNAGKRRRNDINSTTSDADHSDNITFVPRVDEEAQHSHEDLQVHALLPSVKQLNIEEKEQGNDTGGSERSFGTNAECESKKLFNPSSYTQLSYEVSNLYLESHQMDWGPDKQLSESIATFRKGLLDLDPNWYKRISKNNYRYFMPKTTTFDLDLSVFMGKITRTLPRLIDLKKKEGTKFDLTLQDMIKKVAGLVDVLIESISGYFQLYPTKYPVDYKLAKALIMEIMNDQNPTELEDVNAPKPNAIECSSAECGSLWPPSSEIPEVVPNQPFQLTNHLQYLQEEVIVAVLNHPEASLFLSSDNTPYSRLAASQNKERCPVDLTTIKQRLENNYYRDAKQCLQDFCTLFTYYYVFFVPGHDVVRNAQKLEKKFLKMVKHLFTEKEVVL